MSTVKPMVVVLTGASSGIGAALTQALAADGHTVFVCARRADMLAKVTENGRLATPFTCDVSSETDVADFARQVKDRVGRVDALINNAGAYGAIGAIETVDAAHWWRSLQVNLFGTFLMCQAFIPMLRAAGGGRIVNFSGGGAFDPLPNYSAYAVSKAGVVRLTETLAAVLAPAKIQVNAVAPGFVATEIHKATLDAGPERSGEALYRLTLEKMERGAVPIERPVQLVRFLLSPQAEGVTGRTISASFDQWQSPEFTASIANEKNLYTMRRINPENLKK